MRVAVIGKTGVLLAEYPMHGFEDAEGITCMGDGVVAAADERFQRHDFFRLPEQPGQAIEAKERNLCSGWRFPAASCGPGARTSHPGSTSVSSAPVSPTCTRTPRPATC